MDLDDVPRGRLLSRREALRLLGVGGATLLTGLGAGSMLTSGIAYAGCVVRPEQTEGPYYVDEALHRSDIRSDPGSGAISAGTPLDLTFEVSRIVRGSCVPLAGAMVDVWHCDADGHYSDVEDPNLDTRGRKYLRGYQVTDERGASRFATIYPGWYPGRTVHIHFKVRSARSARSAFEFTSQLYFDDALTDRVHARPPYAANGVRRVRNARDGIFRRGGSELTLRLVPKGAGFRSTFEIALAS